MAIHIPIKTLNIFLLTNPDIIANMENLKVRLNSSCRSEHFANVVKGESNRRKPPLSEIAEPPPIFCKYKEKGENIPADYRLFITL